MSFFTFFRKREEQRLREIDVQKRREIDVQKRREYVRELKSTPHEEMFKILREEGKILTLRELYERNMLTHKIRSIWRDTFEEMLIASVDLYKLQCLLDIEHMYFIPREQHSSWNLRLQIFMDTLANLSPLNSLSIVNGIGILVFLNPLGEPVDSSHNEQIKDEIKDFVSKLIPFLF